MKAGLGKIFGGLILAISFSSFAQVTNVLTFTNKQGAVYKNVRVLRIDAERLVYASDESSGGSVKLSDLPDGVLQQLGRDPADLAKRDLEKSIASGMFRKVQGVVYDLRKPQPEWGYFERARLFQKLRSEDAALVDPRPDILSTEVLHVKHLPAYSDTDLFNFRAKSIGTYTYINEAGSQRVVRSYDFGRICGKTDIPDRLLKEGLASLQVDANEEDEKSSLSGIIPSREAEHLKATGTGFFVTEDGYLVTNEHVAHGSKFKVRILSRTLDAELVKSSKVFDLAVLKVEGNFTALPVDFLKGVNLGDAVFTIGFPNIEVQGASPKYTDGKISSLTGIDDDPSQYQISVPVQPGNSGGPLVADNGCVVGIVRGKLNDMASLLVSGSVPQNVNYAVKAKYLRDLLETVPGAIAKLRPAPGTRLPAQNVKVAESATAIVLVY